MKKRVWISFCLISLGVISGYAKMPEVVIYEPGSEPQTSEVSGDHLGTVRSSSAASSSLPAEVRTMARLGVKLEEVQSQLSEVLGKLETIETKLTRLETPPQPPKPILQLQPPAAEPILEGQGENTGPTVSPLDQILKEFESLSPEDAYQKARGYLTQANYPYAEATFKKFVERFPTHTLTTSALYWLGETYFVQKNYAESAKKFAEGYQKDPKGAKGPDHLLKLGMSLKQLNKPKEACTTFKKLKAEFPKASPTILNLVSKEQTLLKCS
jgi:tol-pal system protein YbgF